MPKCDFNKVAKQSVISIKLQSNFIEITLRHGCSPTNLLHLFGHLFLRIPLDGYFLNFTNEKFKKHSQSKFHESFV